MNQRVRARTRSSTRVPAARGRQPVHASDPRACWRRCSAKGGGARRQAADGLRRRLRQRRGPRSAGASPTRIPPRLQGLRCQGRIGSISSSSIPPITSAWRSACSEGLHCSAWDHLAKPGAKPAPGANVARSAGTYMAIQMEAGHQCPITMTNAAVPTLLLEPELAKWWIPQDPVARLRQELQAGRRQARRHHRHGHDGEAGRHGCARQFHARGRRRATAGRARNICITGHKWFMSAPMCDAFLVLAQAPGGLLLLPDAALPARRQRQRAAPSSGSRTSSAIAPMRPREVEFQGAHAWLIGEEGRGVPTIIEMVTCTRLDCAVASAGLMRLALANAIHHCRHRTVFQKHLVDQPLMSQVLADLALDVEAATALSFRLARSFDRASDAHAAAWRRLMTPVTKYWVCKIGPALRLRGDGVPGRQWLCRGGPGGAALSRAAAQRHLGGLRQCHGARSAARPAARARDGRDRHGRSRRRP